MNNQEQEIYKRKFPVFGYFVGGLALVSRTPGDNNVPVKLGSSGRRTGCHTAIAKPVELLRALTGLTAGVFLAFAVMETTEQSHTGNTQWVQTRDGREAVDDDITLLGPDRETVIMLFAISGFAFWFSVAKHESVN